MTEPSARIVADSISPDGHRVTTIEGDLHRFVLAELNTHRTFSRNSASSRAIPLAKQIDRVSNNPALPVKWAAEQKGMQGGDEVERPDSARANWMAARVGAVNYAERLGQLGVHKSIANRLLEPFMWHTVVITATAWENFFGLRCNPMAQPEIHAFADAVKAAYDASTPVELVHGQWHLPYLQDDEHDMPTLRKIKVSAARCARVSYLTQNGVRDFEQDIQLYDRLVSATPMHASPLEHVATPSPENVQHVRVHRRVSLDGVHNGSIELTLPRYGNLLGWHQHRFDVEVLGGYQAFA